MLYDRHFTQIVSYLEGKICRVAKENVNCKIDVLRRVGFPFFTTELNNLRKIICLRNSEVSKVLKEFQFVMSLKIWRSMANTVRHTPIQMTS